MTKGRTFKSWKVTKEVHQMKSMERIEPIAYLLISVEFRQYILDNGFVSCGQLKLNILVRNHLNKSTLNLLVCAAAVVIVNE